MEQSYIKECNNMKKIGIITITNGRNYGNKLQNYALLKSLEKLGFEVETIIKIFKKENKLNLFFYRIKTCIRNVLHINERIGICKRERKFSQFDKRYLKISKYWTYKNEYRKGIADKFDYFVCGSDQIWNTKFIECLEDIESSTAYFAQTEKRIAYAASFGISTLPDEYVELFKKLLRDMKSISVREESGATIIKNILNKNVPVTLDPTLLLNQEEWKEFQNKPKTVLPQKYIATYFLGNKSKEVEEYIKELSEKYNYPIIELDCEWLWDKDISNLDYFSLDPTEFVYVISHSEMLFTDSFHGSVFSVIFDKPFRVFKRNDNFSPDMWSRMDTLINLIDDYSVIGDTDESLENIVGKRVKYDKEKIEVKRKGSLEYLKNALNVNSNS